MGFLGGDGLCNKIIYIIGEINSFVEYKAPDYTMHHLVTPHVGVRRAERGTARTAPYSVAKTVAKDGAPRGFRRHSAMDVAPGGPPRISRSDSSEIPSGLIP
jgi:hypothetical protein